MAVYCARGAVGYRTKALPLEQAASFARCLRGNADFTDVGLEESRRAPGKWLVTFLPSNPARVADIAQRQADARQARAENEGRDYLFCADKDGGRLFWWCLSTSGEVYEVTPESCSCPDEEYRRCPGGCKHQRALRLALAEGRVGEFQPAGEIARVRAAEDRADADAVFGRFSA